MPENEYARYLPHIDIKGGINRVMNNKKIYITLLTKFKAREMTEDLLAKINEQDFEKIMTSAHALKGAAGNLGAKALADITIEVEEKAKKGESPASLADTLKNIIDEYERSLKEFLANES